MSEVLFLNIPAYGHVNPTLGLVDALVKQGENVTYFCTEEFKDKIEGAGAKFKSYKGENNPLNKKETINSTKANMETFLKHISYRIEKFDLVLEDVLSQIAGEKYDYVVTGAMFPYGKAIADILKIPCVSSFAIFATPKELLSNMKDTFKLEKLKDHPINDLYKNVSEEIKEKYNIKLPENMVDLFFSKGDINIAYTSEYFVSNIDYYDDTFKFIGPPIYDRKENLDFPFEKLKGKKVIYISFGTVFNNNSELYSMFFEAFKDEDVIVVMSAYNLDLSEFDIPNNFIVRDYVPQSEILKYTDVAITHAGMNSTSDLIFNNVPFVAIPIGADQPYMASRAAELGAAISLDKDKVDYNIIKAAVKKVMTDSSYVKNLKKINESFKTAGGYKKAAEEIFKLKRERKIMA